MPDSIEERQPMYYDQLKPTESNEAASLQSEGEDSTDSESDEDPDSE